MGVIAAFCKFVVYRKEVHMKYLKSSLYISVILTRGYTYKHLNFYGAYSQ
uniref:Uncharacterized protein n=1 Tax=Anguilla anguilla TaxID=7936 RepID=A0A0E9SY23_ANGAN